MAPTVLITGCSSGFGKASARLFAERGWNVVATMRNRATSDLGHPAILVAGLDVQDTASVNAALAAGVERFGRVDTLVNNAGFGAVGVFETIPVETVEEQIGVNLVGVMNTTRAVLPHFRTNKGGMIINITSGGGVAGFALTSVYAATKFAVEGFSESLSWELASQNIVVKIVEPGTVRGTGFGKRSGATAAANRRIPEYDAFTARAAAGFKRFAATATATDQDVAEVIHLAATDETNRLRYIATADVREVAQARRETSEDAYMAYMARMLE